MEESMAHRRIKRGISVVLILFMLVIYVNAPFGNGIRAFGDTVTDLNQAKDKQDQLSSQYEDTKNSWNSSNRNLRIRKVISNSWTEKCQRWIAVCSH